MLLLMFGIHLPINYMRIPLSLSWILESESVLLYYGIKVLTHIKCEKGNVIVSWLSKE